MRQMPAGMPNSAIATIIGRWRGAMLRDSNAVIFIFALQADGDRYLCLEESLLEFRAVPPSVTILVPTSLIGWLGVELRTPSTRLGDAFK